MAESGTNFPPQIYSSSFFLNRLSDEDRNGTEKTQRRDRSRTEKAQRRMDEGTDTSSDETSLLSCFITPNSEKDVGDLWKGKHHSSKPMRSESPHNAFKRWRKSAGLKLSESKNNAMNGLRLASNNDRQIKEEMTLLKFLAINALELSAPASDILLKSRNSTWFQLSGHPDSLAPAGPGTVWKRLAGSDDTERIVYEELSQDPLLCDIIPRYYREVEYQGEKFIELQDLLHDFQDPYVIDIKMGTRTFLESEVEKTTARADLYQKMIAIDPDAPTAEEHENQAVTKLRYMQFRELQSSTCSHGFRIEAMKCRGSPPMNDLKKVKSSEEVSNTLDTFLGGRDDVRIRLLGRLYEIRSKIEQSNYFKTREVVGSSLFIIYEESKVGVWLIDFAKTNKLPHGMTVNHRTTWVQGNHEEGLLFGLDQLISIVENLKTSPKPKDFLSKTVSTVSVKS